MDLAQSLNLLQEIRRSKSDVPQFELDVSTFVNNRPTVIVSAWDFFMDFQEYDSTGPFRSFGVPIGLRSTLEERLRIFLRHFDPIFVFKAFYDPKGMQLRPPKNTINQWKNQEEPTKYTFLHKHFSLLKTILKEKSVAFIVSPDLFEPQICSLAISKKVKYIFCSNYVAHFLKLMDVENSIGSEVGFIQLPQSSFFTNLRCSFSNYSDITRQSGGNKVKKMFESYIGFLVYNIDKNCRELISSRSISVEEMTNFFGDRLPVYMDLYMAIDVISPRLARSLQVHDFIHPDTNFPVNGISEFCSSAFGRGMYLLTGVDGFNIDITSSTFPIISESTRSQLYVALSHSHISVDGFNDVIKHIAKDEAFTVFEPQAAPRLTTSQLCFYAMSNLLRWIDVIKVKQRSNGEHRFSGWFHQVKYSDREKPGRFTIPNDLPNEYVDIFVGWHPMMFAGDVFFTFEFDGDGYYADLLSPEERYICRYFGMCPVTITNPLPDTMQYHPEITAFYESTIDMYESLHFFMETIIIQHMHKMQDFSPNTCWEVARALESLPFKDFNESGCVLGQIVFNLISNPDMFERDEDGVWIIDSCPNFKIEITRALQTWRIMMNCVSVLVSKSQRNVEKYQQLDACNELLKKHFPFFFDEN
ncbi:hypothetical protein PCE1_002653 [Barthelona sp. PCE]